ncbi:heparinase [Alsobacter soli]|uniref:Heparinase n=1 Tax=Alsobacter soli TaxID=2109933 RepID=A0A2T1HMU8_9HYPH|nr:heparinase II/III family protein [Alsobacter soli]PSC02952.1 heparinase [Alsobacter soli]
MTTRVTADRWRLAWLVARLGLRRSLGALLAPVRALTPSGKPAAERLVVAPQDLRTTDPTVANDIYAGYFAFAGKVVAAGGRSPFQLEPASTAWAEGLMGFGWLRHLRAAESALARANARALVDDWIAACGRPRGIAWETGVMARRLMSWLSQSPVILDGADREFYRKFLRSLSRQATRLQKQLARTEDGERRLLGAIALAYVALCTGAGPSAQKRASRQLAEELDRQILPDGGHVARNPRVLVDLLTDLLPLRQVYANQGVEPPRALLNGIDRMMPMLRMFRHGDGSLALFNGMSVTPLDTLVTLLAYTDARSQATENAPHTGFQRLQARGSLVIMDVGPPPPQAFSGKAHAGCLSFEFSDGPCRLVVNCGAPPPGGDPWRQMARATAAHSTVTVNDTSSCRFVQEGPAFLGSPILAGPREVVVERQDQRDSDEPSIGVAASHDGYKEAFGVIHARRITLAASGDRLAGEDAIRIAAETAAQAGPDHFAVRFHLHPTVHLDRGPDGLSVRLATPGGGAWVFEAGGMPVSVEESIFFAAPDGARRSEQLVVHGAYRSEPVVRWSFTREPRG